MNLLASFSTDFQPYLLPGTDPWALPEEKVVCLLNYLKTREIERIYCIPPIKLENRSNTTNSLQNAFLSFRQRFSTECELRLAARYRLDDGFSSILKGSDLLSIGNSLIVDVSPLQEHKHTWKMIGEIIEAGYIPILIQPERTTYWKEDDFLRLKESGVRLMMNLYSLFGYNGDNALMYSRWMLSEGMYDYMCSGMEDTRIMKYSENFTSDADDISIKELGENDRLLWESTNGKR
jgi:tyrosine-protein phosphatase YwqE